MKKKNLIWILIITAFLGGCGCNHQWIEATCERASYCELCGEENGNIIECVPGEIEIVKKATLVRGGETITKCIFCQKVLTNESYQMDVFVENGSFSFNLEEFEESFKVSNKKELTTRIYQYMYDDIILLTSTDREGKVKSITFASPIELPTGVAAAFAAILFDVDTYDVVYDLILYGEYEDDYIKLYGESIDTGYLITLKANK